MQHWQVRSLIIGSLNKPTISNAVSFLEDWSLLPFLFRGSGIPFMNSTTSLRISYSLSKDLPIKFNFQFFFKSDNQLYLLTTTWLPYAVANSFRSHFFTNCQKYSIVFCTSFYKINSLYCCFQNFFLFWHMCFEAKASRWRKQCVHTTSEFTWANLNNKNYQTQ